MRSINKLYGNECMNVVIYNCRLLYYATTNSLTNVGLFAYIKTMTLVWFPIRYNVIPHLTLLRGVWTSWSMWCTTSNIYLTHCWQLYSSFLWVFFHSLLGVVFQFSLFCFCFHCELIALYFLEQIQFSIFLWLPI